MPPLAHAAERRYNREEKPEAEGRGGREKGRSIVRKENGKRMQWVADGLCLLTAAIWGTGFIASQAAIDADMSAALIMALRFTLAAVVMLLVCLPRLRGFRVHEWKVGSAAGLALFGAFFTQIVGQQYTTVSHCAFLTATNVVLVPFLVWIFRRRRPSARTFACAAAALLGIGLLSITPGSFALSFGFGDAMSLLCALLFALHITSLGRLSPEDDVLRVNLVQLSVAAVVSVAVFLITDLHAVEAVNWNLGLPAVVYLGLFSTCLCYFLQTTAQKYTSPSQAGVLLSAEGLFGSLFSVLLGMEPFTVNLAVGGLIILAAVIGMELSPRKKQPEKG